MGTTLPGRRVATLTIVVFLVGAMSTVVAGWDKELVEALNSRSLCSRIEFARLEIDVLDGIRDHDTGGAFRVRVGDPLTFVDANEHENGYELELVLSSPGLRSDEAEITIFFAKPAVKNTTRTTQLDIKTRYSMKFVNWEELDKALALFAGECSQAPTSNSE